MSSVSFSELATTPETPQQNPRLISAAHEFEASLMKEFLKPLQHDSLFAENDDKGNDEPTGSAETLISYGAEAMAKAISEHGGFGIAQKILDHFQLSTNLSRVDVSSRAVRF